MILGAALARRVIEPTDDHVSSGAAVISHAFWRSVLGGDPAFWDAASRSIASTTPSRRHAGKDSAVTPPRGWTSGADCRRHARHAGVNFDGFHNIVEHHRARRARRGGGCRRPASAALERRVSLVSLDGGEVASTDRRIAYALAGVSFLVLSSASRTRRRCCSCAKHAAGAGRPSARPSARRADALCLVLFEAAILATMATAGALALSSAARRNCPPLDPRRRDRARASRPVRSSWRSRPAWARSCGRSGALQLRHLRAGDLTGTSSDARRSRACPTLLSCRRRCRSC
jgi:hypothetical protein